MNAKITVKIDAKKLQMLVDKELTDIKYPIIGEILSTDAALLTPVGKYPKLPNRVGGRLRGSITWSTIKRKSEVDATGKPSATSKDAIPQPTNALTLYIGSAVEYAIWVEFGGGKRKGRFMFTKALKGSKDKINTILAL